MYQCGSPISEVCSSEGVGIYRVEPGAEPGEDPGIGYNPREHLAQHPSSATILSTAHLKIKQKGEKKEILHISIVIKFPNILINKRKIK